MIPTLLKNIRSHEVDHREEPTCEVMDEFVSTAAMRDISDLLNELLHFLENYSSTQTGGQLAITDTTEKGDLSIAKVSEGDVSVADDPETE